MNYKHYIRLEHIATTYPHVEPLNGKECQLLLNGSKDACELAFDSIAERMGCNIDVDEDGLVTKDHLGNHYLIDQIVVDGQDVTSL